MRLTPLDGERFRRLRDGDRARPGEAEEAMDVMRWQRGVAQTSSNSLSDALAAVGDASGSLSAGRRERRDGGWKCAGCDRTLLGLPGNERRARLGEPTSRQEAAGDGNADTTEPKVDFGVIESPGSMLEHTVTVFRIGDAGDSDRKQLPPREAKPSPPGRWCAPAVRPLGLTLRTVSASDRGTSTSSARRHSGNGSGDAALARTASGVRATASASASANTAAGEGDMDADRESVAR